MRRLASNTLSVLAGRVREAQTRARAASQEAAAQSIEAGRLLCKARSEARHGEWMPFLEAAGVHERQARRLMRLARSGLKPDTVSGLGGIKEALRLLSRLDAEGGNTDPEEVARTVIHGRLLNDAEAECPGIVDATIDRVAAEGADDMLAAFWRAMGHPEMVPMLSDRWGGGHAGGDYPFALRRAQRLFSRQSAAEESPADKVGGAKESGRVHKHIQDTVARRRDQALIEAPLGEGAARG